MQVTVLRYKHAGGKEREERAQVIFSLLPVMPERMIYFPAVTSLELHVTSQVGVAPPGGQMVKPQTAQREDNNICPRLDLFV